MLNEKPQYKIYPIMDSGFHQVHVSHGTRDWLTNMKPTEIDNLKGDISYVEPVP